MEQYAYLIADLFCIAGPLAFSWDKRTRFIDQQIYFWPAALIIGAFFILWDIRFATEGYWGFSDQYITGIRILHLPIEEWLFFIAVPFACLFSHVSVRYYLPKSGMNPKVGIWIARILAIICLILSATYGDKAYTSWNYGLNAVFLMLLGWVWKPKFITKLFITYGFVLIPFLLINGFLTGTFFSEGEIVWYNNAENLGIRLRPTNIPVEDIMYGFLHIGGIIAMFEYLKRKGKVESKKGINGH